MIWAALDLDILDDPAFIELEDEVPGAFWLWCRILQQAKRVNQHGLVLRADGRPLTAKDLRRIHPAASLDTWEGLVDRCVELELLEFRDGIYQIADWRRWHRSPSDDREQVAARVRRHRAKNRVTTPSEVCNEDVTTRNESNDTEQSRAEHISTPNPKCNEGGEQLSNGRLEGAAERIVLQLTPGGMTSALRKKLRAFLAAPDYTSQSKLEALSVGLAEVRSELESAGSAQIRAPDHLLLTRAQANLLRPASPTEDEMFF